MGKGGGGVACSRYAVRDYAVLVRPSLIGGERASGGGEAGASKCKFSLKILKNKTAMFSKSLFPFRFHSFSFRSFNLVVTGTRRLSPVRGAPNVPESVKEIKKRQENYLSNGCHTKVALS